MAFCKTSPDFSFTSKPEHVPCSRALPFCLVGKFLPTSLPAGCYSHFPPLEGLRLGRGNLTQHIGLYPGNQIFSPVAHMGSVLTLILLVWLSQVGSGKDGDTRLATGVCVGEFHTSVRQAIHCASSLQSLSSIIQGSGHTLDR